MDFLDNSTLPQRETLPKATRQRLARFHVDHAPMRLTGPISLMDFIVDGFIEFVPPEGRMALTNKAIRVCRAEIAAERKLAVKPTSPTNRRK